MHKLALLFVLVSLSGIVYLFAQSAEPRAIGHTPTEAERRLWESPALSDGSGLPAGSGDAAQGRGIFLRKCSGCHGEHGEGRDPVGPQLVGGIGTLGTQHPILTVGSYWPYSTSLWDYIHRAMPYYPTPGTLNADETYAVTAYILHLNNIIGENEMMNQVTLPKVKMPNRNGFITDPRPDVHTPISPAPSNATKEKP